MCLTNCLYNKITMITVTLILLLSPASVLSAADFQLYLVRHAEKAKQPNKDPVLTEQGHLTAKAFADYLKDKNISRVYSSDYQRTRQTAEHFSKQHKVLITIYDPRKLPDLARSLITAKQTAYIVGHSNTTPELVNLLGGAAEPISEKDYGQIYHLKFNGDSVQTEMIDIKNKD